MSIFHSHTTRVFVIEKTYIYTNIHAFMIDTPMGMFHTKNTCANHELIRSYKNLKRERVLCLNENIDVY